jgi:hypothetical protein
MSGRTVAGVLGALLIAAVAGTFYMIRQKRIGLDRVWAQEAKLTIGEDSESLQEIEREGQPEVFYRVTLRDMPLGDRVQMECRWVNAQGRITRNNKYQTQKVTSATWHTWCRERLVRDSPPGDWTVEMYLDGRRISTTEFRVK